MKLKLKTAIVDHLDNEAAGTVKGGTATELTSMIPTLAPSEICQVNNTNFGPTKY